MSGLIVLERRLDQRSVEGGRGHGEERHSRGPGLMEERMIVSMRGKRLCSKGDKTRRKGKRRPTMKEERGRIKAKGPDLLIMERPYLK